ncbi:DEAH-box ATP-dependent RNA helicase PRP22 NDAI_0E03620 [Naumovozyma dairenensis CBS 421]|uniref:RNA helicase n=1 Tax=Naumovozyma dairenensis (strain ATCC 10597 / BCRC 20456 / CBS 421 / NBRC 0211 / NRRL Y-12639) TaxID=1071378 RepID=G0WBQ9_NAUDC|nr:hypothetical protein NDAI_0E03620 [Naumovozyma dairenensis CBS 421]CCD25179.1 hypothetical protein NDAI_0E03620 [Naumovozyma dairenensis CBS 421]
MNIILQTKSLEEFRDKLEELESGIGEETIFKIYNLVHPMTGDSKMTTNNNNNPFLIVEKKEVIHNPFTLPDQKVEWNDLTDNKDILPPKSQQLDSSPRLHKIYRGKVRKITTFGCFVEILGVQMKDCDGLVHISELSDHRVKDPYEVVGEGQYVYVKVIKIQRNGRISLSMKHIDQKNGKEMGGGANAIPLGKERGRGHEKSNQNIGLDKSIKRRALTSPERWEIRQLISSGAASIEDYPELQEEDKNKAFDPNATADAEDVREDEQEADEVQVEANTDDTPDFLKGQLEKGNKRYEMPKIVKVPRGSMNRAATYGSNTIKTHREEKLAKKKEIEQEIRKMKVFDDPTSSSERGKEEIDMLRKQLVVTEWERSRMKEQISYGKRTSMPISSQRKSLPVYKMRSELVEAVQKNQFLVIVGETGSGKTTQITQYLNEEGFSNHGIIGCTQPRRVAAVSVAKRVAEEVGCKLGEEVGYTIRFEDRTSRNTQIKYMTDGMLQRECLLDSKMSKYSVIMLDEAHERTVATDVLFALLKKAAIERPDLRVIVTSATLNSARFSEYFNNCPVVNIPGKTFPVEVLYSQTPQMDYIEAALESVMNIHINDGPGDILVFLTGQEEIDACCEMLYERVKTLGDAIDDLLILPVYSALPSEIQSKIFEPTPKGSRKVVFATNIAETSITIDGIFYVIDPGFAKINTYNPRAAMEQLIVSPISQAQANQRKGRAGRTGPGKCYRLYTETAFYNEMLPNSIPEIQRQNLSHTILMLKAMGINDLLNFDFMDPPPKNLMTYALDELYNLEALNNEGLLTKLGMRMSQFPMDPTLSRALLSSVTNNCSDETITIIAMLSVQNVFSRPKGKQQDADNKKARFHHPYGDHLTLLNVYNRWEQNGYSDEFCNQNFLQARHLKRARDVKNQISMIFRKLGLPLVSCHGDPDLIRRTLVNGFFMNAAKRDSQVGYKTITGGTVVGIHPSSSLYGKEYEYVIYHSLVLTTKEYMSQVTSIEPSWLVELAPHYYKPVDSESVSRKKAKITPLYNKFSKDQNSWRLSSIRQSRERALGVKR